MEACKDYKVDMIIIGISSGGILSEHIMGNDAVIIARNAPVPVIVVPENIHFKAINTMLLVSDLKDLENETPVSAIKSILNDTKARLITLHVHDCGHAHYKDTMAREKIKDLFVEYNPELYFIAESDFVESINKFAKEMEAGLIICIPKKHSFLETIFKKNHTKELAYHSNLPLLTVHLMDETND